MIGFKIAATAFILLVVVGCLLSVVGDPNNRTQMRLFGSLIIVLGLTTVGGLIAGVWLL